MEQILLLILILFTLILVIGTVIFLCVKLGRVNRDIRLLENDDDRWLY